MPKRPFRIGRSHTGLGLFATRPIRKGARIAEYKGPLLTDQEPPKSESARQPLPLRAQQPLDHRRLAAQQYRALLQPFLQSERRNYDVRHRVFIRTLRNIKPGEEITYDYGIDYLRNVIGRSNCKCSPLPQAAGEESEAAPRPAQASGGAAARQAATQVAGLNGLSQRRHSVLPCPLAQRRARRGIPSARGLTPP